MKKVMIILLLVILSISITGCDIPDEEEKYEYTNIYKNVKYDYSFVEEYHSIKGNTKLYYYIFSTETNKFIYAKGYKDVSVDHVNSITFGEYEGKYGENVKIILENDETPLYFSFKDGRLCKTDKDWNIVSVGYDCNYNEKNVKFTIELLNEYEKKRK